MCTCCILLIIFVGVLFRNLLEEFYLQLKRIITSKHIAGPCNFSLHGHLKIKDRWKAVLWQRTIKEANDGPSKLWPLASMCPINLHSLSYYIGISVHIIYLYMYIYMLCSSLCKSMKGSKKTKQTPLVYTGISINKYSLPLATQKWAYLGEVCKNQVLRNSRNHNNILLEYQFRVKSHKEWKSCKL